MKIRARPADDAWQCGEGTAVDRKVLELRATSRRTSPSKGKTHGSMTTGDSPIGSNSQHRLSDQVSANTNFLGRARRGEFWSALRVR
jgi:hypothetical protein